MNPGVRDALDGVYRALESPVPQSIDACPCCVSESQVQVLLSKPLREITADELSPYASAVLVTSGDVADFRYFLPRILEISLAGRWWPDIEVTLSKLAMAGWDNWPAAERDALMKLFEHAFDETVETSSSHPLHLDIDSWICGLGLAGVDLEPFLRKLEDPAAAHALLQFIRYNDQYRQYRTLANPFWDKDRTASDPVVNWLHSTRGRTAIERARSLH